jgi:hypothetical protein
LSNKNQHFVSQTYLRWFGIPRGDEQPKSINLFATKTKKIVLNASIKRQCSRNYFYGRDAVVEDLLQFFEGRYGAAMASLDRGAATTEQLGSIIQFLFLQYLRTPFQLRERLRLISEFASMEIGGKKVRDKLPDPDNAREMQHQIYIFAKEHSAFADLEMVLLVNNTKIPFVTSDNPAIFMNRLYSQRYSDPTAGVIQSGAVTTMPLTPRIALLAYDSDVYQAVGRNSVLEVRNESDVNRLNELQVIRASDALFFQAESDSAYVTDLFDRYRSGRRTDWSFTWVGIRDGEDDEFERYRTMTAEDKDSLEPRIQSMSPLIPAPTIWPTFIKFKLRPKGWSNGSVVGFIRWAHTDRSSGFRQSVLPRRLPRNHSAAHRDVIFQRKDRWERPV